MYVNLILGILVIVALIWLLVLYNRKSESPREMLADEISRRRAAQEIARKAAAALEQLRDEKLELVERDLAEMRLSLPREGLPENSLDWRRDGEALALTLLPGRAASHAARQTGEDRSAHGETMRSEQAGRAEHAGQAEQEAARAEEYRIRWDIRNIDLDFLAGLEQAGNVPGLYSLTWPDGHVTREEERSDFMRVLSGLIADRLA